MALLTRIAALVGLLLGGCSDVVVDPFAVDPTPPPRQIDLVLDVQGLVMLDMLTLHVYFPELGELREATVVGGAAMFVLPSAIDETAVSVLVAGYVDLDGDACCSTRTDLSFADTVRLTVMEDIAFGTLTFDAMLIVPSGTCSYFETCP